MFRIYWKMEARLVPGLRSTQYAFADVLEKQLESRPHWLEIGCGRRPFPEWMPKQQARALALSRTVVGLDLDFDSLREHTAYPNKVLASA